MNLFYLERKFKQILDREKVEVFLNCFMPSDFYLFICRNENFTVLDKISLKYQIVADIINKFVNEGQLLQLRQFF